MSDHDDGAEHSLREASLFKLKRARDRARKHLREHLALSEPAMFLQAIWVLDAIQRGHPNARLYHPRFSDEQATLFADQAMLSPWTLETLVNEYLATPSRLREHFRPKRILDLSHPASAINLVNGMKNLENVEDGVWLKSGNSPIDLMGHFAQRQFPWQRGLSFFLEFYRPLFIFDTPTALQLFQQRHGLSMREFAFGGFAFLSSCISQPYVASNVDMRSIGLSAETRDRILRVLSVPVDDARGETAALRQGSGMTAYKPSILRRYPLLQPLPGQALIAPLPELISSRIGEGIYYDLVGDGAVSHQAGKRFEAYVELILRIHFPDIQMIPEVRYTPRKGAAIDTPDWRVGFGGVTTAVVECKGRRASISARYADDPTSVQGVEELAKGVFQIWRFFSHVRRGLFNDDRITDQTFGILLTLDTWFDMSRNGQSAVMSRANQMADAEVDILALDRRSVGFLHIHDLEGTLASATTSSLTIALEKWIRDPSVHGWSLLSVHGNDRERQERRTRAVFDQLPRPSTLSWWPTNEELAKVTPRKDTYLRGMVRARPK